MVPMVAVEGWPAVPVLSAALGGAASEIEPPVIVTVVVVSAAEAGTAILPASAAEQARTSAVRVFEPMSETPIARDKTCVGPGCSD